MPEQKVSLLKALILIALNRLEVLNLHADSTENNRQATTLNFCQEFLTTTSDGNWAEIDDKNGERVMRGAVKNTLKILTIEDDVAQIEALKEALTVAQIICVEIHEAADGEQGITFLNQEYPFMDAPQPDLIFLSNHLPDMSAEEIIKGLQRDRRLQSIPIALFSEEPPHASADFSFPPNCHMFKRPATCDEWIYVLRCIEDVWITLLNMAGKPHIS